MGIPVEGPIGPSGTQGVEGVRGPYGYNAGPSSYNISNTYTLTNTTITLHNAYYTVPSSEIITSTKFARTGAQMYFWVSISSRYSTNTIINSATGSYLYIDFPTYDADGSRIYAPSVSSDAIGDRKYVCEFMIYRTGDGNQWSRAIPAHLVNNGGNLRVQSETNFQQAVTFINVYGNFCIEQRL